MNRPTFTLAQYHLFFTRAGAALAATTVLSIFLYGTFLLLAVEHAAARTNAQHQIDKLAAHVGDLETQYLTAARTLTPDTAAQLGFVPPTTVTTVYATAASRSLSLRSTN